MGTQDNTELKIKEAARILFQEKGFEGVRTREIAEAAGINSALLHYYFRSKEKLFRIIMVESYQQMFSYVSGCIYDTETTLSQKIGLVVNGFMDVVDANPNLALFVMNELHSNPSLLFKEANIPQKFLYESHLFQQLAEHLRAKNIEIDKEHFFLNLISLTVMPIIARPMLAYIYSPSVTNIDNFIEGRRKLIPQWIKAMLQIEESKD